MAPHSANCGALTFRLPSADKHTITRQKGNTATVPNPRHPILPRLSRWLGFLLVPLLLGAGITDQWDITTQQLDKISARFGEPAKTKIVAWQELIQRYKSVPEKDKLERVNHYFNQMRFTSDMQVWGVDDYWATPVEFLIAGAGDCEDFSMAKYFTLKAMGVPVERMRLTYVKATQPGLTVRAHMVLSYFPDPEAEPWVLDNLIDEIKPSSQRQDLLPVYSFNGDGLWLAKQRGQGQRVGDASRLSLWSGVAQRMQNLLGRLIDD